MPRIVTGLISLCVAGLLAAGAVTAAPREHRASLPHRYAPRSLDGPLVQATNPVDGVIWTAWAYRNGGEYDIALSFWDGRGFWSEPVFFGAGDGVDQVEPALAVDPAGNLYLAFSDAARGRIMVSALRRGSAGWSEPVPLAGTDLRARAPKLLVVGERLVVAYRTRDDVGVVDLPLGGIVANGIIDNPDPVESPGGSKSNDEPNPIDLPDEDRHPTLH